MRNPVVGYFPVNDLQTPPKKSHLVRFFQHTFQTILIRKKMYRHFFLNVVGCTAEIPLSATCYDQGPHPKACGTQGRNTVGVCGGSKQSPPQRNKRKKQNSTNFFYQHFLQLEKKNSSKYCLKRMLIYFLILTKINLGK